MELNETKRGGTRSVESRLDDTAILGPGCSLWGHGKVLDNARIRGNVMVYDGGEVSGNAYVTGKGVVYGKIYDHAIISLGTLEFTINSEIGGNSEYSAERLYCDNYQHRTEKFDCPHIYFTIDRHGSRYVTCLHVMSFTNFVVNERSALQALAFSHRVPEFELDGYVPMPSYIVKTLEG